MTENQKNIYNTYLSNLRKDQPFKCRKNFDDLDENYKISLEKLDIFFEKYSHINIRDFFKAPNAVYPNDKYPNLSFFTTRPAIKTYTLYKKQKEDENPDNLHEEIKNGLAFICQFCINNEIELKNYLKHKSGYMFSWIIHYKEHRINAYCLMELGNFESSLYSLTQDEKDIYTSTLIDKIESYKVRYYNSPKTKKFLKEKTKKIEDFIKEKLQ